jgi:hypothetical protein
VLLLLLLPPRVVTRTHQEVKDGERRRKRNPKKTLFYPFAVGGEGNHTPILQVLIEGC